MGDAAHDRLWSRTEYRRVIDWPERIRREAPFLDAVTRAAPVRKLLDVGCGSGEHTRHFAELGWRAVGIDVSERMIEEAKVLAGTTAAGGLARFEQSAAAEAAQLPEAPFGAAICLGNTLAFLETESDVRGLFGGVAAALAPGAPFLVQMLNYERIRALPVRALPVNVRPLPEGEGDGEIVFLRVLRPREDGDVDFYPITLELLPGGDDGPEVRVRAAKHVVHHAWTRATLEPALAEAGFEQLRLSGGMAETPWSREESPDLVLRCVKRT
ncbi:MAG: class I SAM-dependent methyltransferase [Candidatus Eiseniibacteriota bacterium]